MIKTSWTTTKSIDVRDSMEDKAAQTKETWKSWVSRTKCFEFYSYLTMYYLPLEPVQSIKHVATQIQNQRQFWNIHVKWSWIYS